MGSRLGAEEGAVELEERAGAAVDDEHVAVAVAAVAALDRGAGRDREGPGVALVAISGVMDRQLASAGVDDGEGEAVGAWRAEVRVQVVAAVGVDVGDVCSRARVAGRLGDVLVPGGLVGEGGRPRRELGGRVGEDLAGAEFGGGARGAGGGDGEPQPAATDYDPTLVGRNSVASLRQSLAHLQTPREGADRHRAAGLRSGERAWADLGAEEGDAATPGHRANRSAPRWCRGLPCGYVRKSVPIQNAEGGPPWTSA
jgi:hypothetical protein